MPDILTINTLGMFLVSIGDTVISDSSVRSQKVWKIFKYLITNRHKMVPVETLIEIIWPEDGPDNPQKSLYTLMARLRKLLSDSGADGSYILFRHDCYQWNSKLPVALDVAEFEQLLLSARAAREDEEKLPFFKKAVEMYIGDYLSESAYEAWIQPVTNYYKRLYLSAVNDLADIYLRICAYDDIIRLCSKAIETEPYEESLYGRMIQAFIINGNTVEAQKHYRYFDNLMQREFGAHPSEGLRALYRQMQEADGEERDLSAIKRRLDGEGFQKGVFFCSADIFNRIYQFDKRSDERMKFPVFLGLITLVFEGDAPGEKSLKSTMLLLRQALMHTLRKGDIVSQYSKSQYLLMLSAYRPEDAETAMARLRQRFETEAPGFRGELDISLSQIGDRLEITGK